MEKKREDARQGGEAGVSRRSFMMAAGTAAGSVLAVGAMPVLAQAKKAETAAAPDLPWPWVKLDPQEAGERAFRTYHEKGG